MTPAPLALVMALGLGCAADDGLSGAGTSEATRPDPAPLEGEDEPLADVLGVAVSGKSGAWTFDVTVDSPDVDCGQYADWWEVVTQSGELVYRRILNHSHPDEQPFTRDGGPVPADADQALIVRAHLNPGGYGGAAVKGTAGGGFEAADVAADFAASLETTAPLPEACWY